MSNTTIGTTSDSSGYFIIKNHLKGNFTLYISCVGYTAQKIEISIEDTDINAGVIKLIKLDIELGEIEIKGEKDTNWENNLKIFQKLLLGENSNAQGCQLLNPEIINFSEMNNKIIAKSSDLIMIENRALGYKILVDIIDFEWNSNDLQKKYQITPYFRDLLEKDENIKTSFYEKRKTAYYGSKKHFFISLIKNTLNKEGFLIIKYNPEPVDKIETRIKREGKTETSSIKNILIINEKKGYYRLSSNDSYYVCDTKDGNEDDYQKYAKRYNYPILPDNSQLTIIKFHTANMIIDENGEQYFRRIYYDLGGYWSYKGLSDLLPADYNPDKNIEDVKKRIKTVKKLDRRRND